MCGRFTLYHAPDEIAERFAVAEILQTEARYNIAPTQTVAAVTQNGTRHLENYHWGLIPSWAKDPSIGSRMINARAETLAEKPSFRTALVRRRCLIPADGFYEWQAAPEGAKGGKTPTYLHRKDSGLFAFAGLWDEWATPDGSPLRSCTIITTTPNSVAAPVHDRMPVILRPEDEAFWLDTITDSHALLSLLVPYPAEEMEAYPVSRRVNVPVSDDPALLARV